MLAPRLLTAVVGIPILLGAIFFGGLPYFFVVLAIVLLGLREFYHLARETGYPCYSTTGTLFGGLLVASIFLNGVTLGSVTENQATAAVLSILLAVLIVRSLWKGPADTTLSEWAVTLFGIFYISWTLGHLILLRDFRPKGDVITFYLFAMIWVADVTAYLVGTRIGKRKIAEAISPKKSWEGTMAGVVGAIVVGVLFQLTALRTMLSLPEAMLLSLVMGILAFWSDLGESMLKRGAGVKESSLLLPGHGGILDRFDSFLLTTPLFYYYWAFFKH